MIENQKYAECREHGEALVLDLEVDTGVYHLYFEKIETGEEETWLKTESYEEAMEKFKELTN